MSLKDLVARMILAGVPEQEIGSYIKTYGSTQDDRPISTITSQPVPTSQEVFEQTGKAARTVLPIAGDVALTAFAPQVKALSMGGRAVNLGLRAAAAAAGAGGGAKIADILSGDGRDTAMPAAALGAAGELAFAGGGAALTAGKRIVKPVVDWVGDLTQIGKVFKQKAGRMVLDKQEELKRMAAERAMTFLDEIAPDVVKQRTNAPNLAVKLDEAVDEVRDSYGFITEAMERFAARNGGLVDIQGTADILKGVKSWNAEYGWKPGSAQVLELKRIIAEKGDVSPDTVNFVLSSVFKRGKQSDWNQLSPTQQANREKLKAALMEDLDDISASAGKTAADLKREADETFKAIARFKKVQNIYKLSSTKDRATGKMFVYPDELSARILSSKGRIEKEMPDLWPKLEAEAAFYADLAKKYDRLPVDGAYDVFTAWSMLSPQFKQTVARLSDIGKFTVEGAIKPAVKAGLQVGGQEVYFDREP